MQYFNAGTRIVPINSEVTIDFIEKNGVKHYYVQVGSVKLSHIIFKGEESYVGAVEILHDIIRQMSQPNGEMIRPPQWAIRFNPEG